MSSNTAKGSPAAPPLQQRAVEWRTQVAGVAAGRCRLLSGLGWAAIQRVSLRLGSLWRCLAALVGWHAGARGQAGTHPCEVALRCASCQLHTLLRYTFVCHMPHAATWCGPLPPQRLQNKQEQGRSAARQTATAPGPPLVRRRVGGLQRPRQQRQVALRRVHDAMEEGLPALRRGRGQLAALRGASGGRARGQSQGCRGAIGERDQAANGVAGEVTPWLEARGSQGHLLGTRASIWAHVRGCSTVAWAGQACTFCLPSSRAPDSPRLKLGLRSSAVWPSVKDMVIPACLLVREGKRVLFWERQVTNCEK